MDIELMQKLGNMEQLAGIRETTILRGPGKGLNIIEVYNAAGLRFSVLPDRGMDIYDFSYKGQNLAFKSKNGLCLNRNPAEDEFFHTWPGGILSTCGLANVGDACVDGGVQPIHGRIGSTPARNISVSEGWQGNEYILTVSGEIKETRLYSRVLSLRRSISVGLFDKALTIKDTVINENVADEDFMMLYHFNFGYPLLDVCSKVVCSASDAKPLNDFSKDFANMRSPGAEAGHQMFLFTPEEKYVRAAVINPEAGIGAVIEYNADNLPYLCEWKNLSKHDYVVALEPSNCLIMGRTKERENGTLRSLPAYSSVSNSVKLGVLDGKDEIQAFILSCK